MQLIFLNARRSAAEGRSFSRVAMLMLTQLARASACKLPAPANGAQMQKCTCNVLYNRILFRVVFMFYSAHAHFAHAYSVPSRAIHVGVFSPSFFFVHTARHTHAHIYCRLPIRSGSVRSRARASLLALCVFDAMKRTVQALSREQRTCTMMEDEEDDAEEVGMVVC